MLLGKLGYYGDFFICIALIVAFSGITAFDSWLNVAQWLVCVGFGAGAWTLIEYVVHRWVYHQVPYFRGRHELHHDAPGADIGSPPLLGIVLIFSAFFVPVVATSFVVASGLTTGVLAGYTLYMLVHHADHHWTPAPATWFFRVRHQHAIHHHHSEQRNFGIITLFWDRVFGTAGAIKKVAVRADV
ncbi:MAG: sterol desaturase family protein [Hyphomicrobiaceae bacterium]